MTRGPLEFVVIGFKDNHFTGEIMPHLRALSERGIARLIDLLFLTRDAQGTLRVIEINDLPEEVGQIYADFAQGLEGLLTQEDIQMLAKEIPPNSSAAIALLEHVWAIKLREAIARAGGRFLAGGMVNPAIQEMIEAELAAVSSTAKGRGHV